MTTTAIGRLPETAPLTRALRWAGVALVGASWVSAAAFALYIVAFYLGALRTGQMEQWNNNLPGLYSKGNTTALASMTAHLAMGAIVLLLGPVQLMGSVRSRWPAVHRWLGRVYVVTSGLAGLGGLIFIAVKGTIGGTPMSIGFGLYGVLMVLAAEETWRHAMARRFDTHRKWAIRLFALAIGSWLYRMDYGFWLIAAHGYAHTEDFHGMFDVVMAYFFYLPNLLVAEIFLRARGIRASTAVRGVGVVVLTLATLVVAVGTYYFLRFYWGPGILDAVMGK